MSDKRQPGAAGFALLAACLTMAISPASSVISQREGDQNKRAALGFLKPILQTSGRTARFYYRADCQQDYNYPIPFPKVATQPPEERATSLSAIRSIFWNDKAIKVVEAKSGIVRIRIGDVPEAILHTKISLLTLTPVEQYDVQSVIRAIENTTEFREAMHKIGLQRVSRVSSQLAQLPAEGLPHLPSSMANITVEDALDSVATTFKVVVMFGYCPSPQTYDISFASAYPFHE